MREYTNHQSPRKRYEIRYGEELIGEFFEGDLYRSMKPLTDESMLKEFYECVANLGRRKNRKEWRLVIAHRYHP